MYCLKHDDIEMVSGAGIWNDILVPVFNTAAAVTGEFMSKVLNNEEKYGATVRSISQDLQQIGVNIAKVLEDEDKRMSFFPLYQNIISLQNNLIALSKL